MWFLCYRMDFATYAETCFQKFGDRVKHWITFNEPHTFATQGYDVGLQAPGRCSILLHLFCRAGNSATEPYIVAHNVLLSHATVAYIFIGKIYKYRCAPSEIIGRITRGSFWCHLVWATNKYQRRHWCSSKSSRFSAGLVSHSHFFFCWKWGAKSFT